MKLCTRFSAGVKQKYFPYLEDVIPISISWGSDLKSFPLTKIYSDLPQFRHWVHCTRLKLAWSLLFQNSFQPLLSAFYPISSFLVRNSTRCKHWQNHRVIWVGKDLPYSCWICPTFQAYLETLMCTLWKHSMLVQHTDIKLFKVPWGHPPIFSMIQVCISQPSLLIWEGQP